MWGRYIEFGVDIISTYLSKTTKKPLAVVGSAVGEETDADNVQWYQHVGFVSRPPNKSSDGKNCPQGVMLRMGDENVIIASQDLRGLTLMGNLQPGETCIYAAGPDGTGQSRILLKNGSVSMYTTQGNAVGGQSVVVQATGSGVDIGTPWGAVKIDSSGMKLGTQSAGIQLGSDGKVAIIGTEIALNAGAVSLGANATNPVLHGAPSAEVPSTSVKVAL